ncbi:hypothetical protein K504DRAFT_538329 [Pleomassaria siparia CBS 279.74]|uniref:Uncharacterized protein n=1 Tax=Pleomassaria siparia CBS 279.74 TaxID=1314801 RepID=A0A6G1JW23_9PLEO|nr:hypothetical protein K504DRAFT_538329 [Pleomassaria siparia CBS 279.74]
MSKSLNKVTLQQAGIEFNEDVADPEDIFKECPQAQQLVQYLLNFENIVTLETLEELELSGDELTEEEEAEIVIQEAQPNPKRSAAFKAFQSRYDIPCCDRYYHSALQIKKEAGNVASEDETRWTEIIKHSVFAELLAKARELEKKSRYTAADALTRFRVESEHTWQFSAIALDQHCQKTHPHSNGLTAPKPDLFFAFHGYDEHERTGGPLSADENIHNFTVTELRRTYESYDQLGKETWKHGKRPFMFLPSPCQRFYSATKVPYKDSYCFPWTICEWKHQGQIGKHEERSKLFCQAANGAAVCLTLFANAASGGLPGEFLRDTRPVVYFTFTGHVARVWIGYITSVQKGCYKYQMRRLWKGSLLKVIDTIKLGVIQPSRSEMKAIFNQMKNPLAEMSKVTMTAATIIDAAMKNDAFSFKRALGRAKTMDSLAGDDEEYDTEEDDSDQEHTEEDDSDQEYTEEDNSDQEYIP